DPAIRYDLLLAMGEAHMGIGNTVEAHALFEQGLGLQEASFPGDRIRRVRALVLLSHSRGGNDGIPRAKRHLQEAARLLPASAADSELAADLHVSQGIIQMGSGDLVGAIAELSRGVELLSRLRGPDDDRTASAAITLSW